MMLGSKLSVNFPLCLAPMVGLSHVALRMMVREYLPEGAQTFWPTEMLNSRKLPVEDMSRVPETLRAPEETHLVPQILGNEERAIALSVEKLVAWGAAGIDINMGCPVRKALQHNYGVALMGDAGYAAEVVRMTVRNSSLPVSVKLRAGLTEDRDYLYRFVMGLREAGADWVTLHPRTAAQMRRGSADWDQIRELKARVDFPVIGNGDIQTVDDVLAMLDETGCDMVMAGRALAARPWMLWQLGERLGFGAPVAAGSVVLDSASSDSFARDGSLRKAPSTPIEEGCEYGRSLLRLIHFLRVYFLPIASEDLCLRKLRFHLRTTSVWLVFGHSLMAAISKASSLNEAEEIIAGFFESEIEMSARTDLRQ